MIKFSFIIPFYVAINNIAEYHNFNFDMESLLQQTFKNFEIIICGHKVQEEKIQYINGIKIINIINDTNKIGKLMHDGLKVAEGEFIHIWGIDMVIYPDYIEKLNSYILMFGDDNLYAGNFIRTTHIDSRKNSDNFYFNSFDKPEGIHVYHKRYLEPFNEEYDGYATHWSQEHCFKLWKRVKAFICMQDNYVVHLPHHTRISEEDALINSYKSFEIFKMVNNNKNPYEV